MVSCVDSIFDLSFFPPGFLGRAEKKSGGHLRFPNLGVTSRRERGEGVRYFVLLTYLGSTSTFPRNAPRSGGRR